MGNTEAKGWWFAQVPIWLLCDPDLSEGAKALFGYLKWRQGTDAACWPSKATMATDMGVGTDTIDRRLSELEENGYLVKHLRSGRSTLYQMIADPKGKQAAFEKREEERRQAKYPPAKIPGGIKEGGSRGQKHGGESGAKIPPHDDNQGSDNQGQESLQVRCEPGQLEGEEELAKVFGKKEAPQPIEVGHWLDRIQDQPWLGWSGGRFSERQGISVESQEHAGWLVEKYSNLAPRSDGQWNGWANGCVEIVKAGDGNWTIIEQGIKEAMSRERQYRPQTVACHKGQTNGFAKAIAKVLAESKSTPGSLQEKVGDPLRERLGDRIK